MRWDLETCVVRSFEAGDAAPIARHADNRSVWSNLRDRFPHPYRERDAEAFLAAVASADPETSFAIEAGEEAVGSIGFTLQEDVERCGAEVGYWLGEAHWGSGILSEVLTELTPWALDRYGLTRVFAVPFADNVASRRVLEKAGYELEGIMRRSAIKDGRSKDQALYAWVRQPAADPAGFLSAHGP